MLGKRNLKAVAIRLLLFKWLSFTFVAGTTPVHILHPTRFHHRPYGHQA